MRWQTRTLTTACVATICAAASGQKIGKPAPEIDSPDFFGRGKPLSIERYNGTILVLFTTQIELPQSPAAADHFIHVANFLDNLERLTRR